MRNEFLICAKVLILILLFLIIVPSDRISPICLPVSRDLQERNFVGLTPFIAGWGRLGENALKPYILQVE